MSLLQVADLRGSYGPMRVLHGLDFAVEASEIVVILGANGAGKTSTLRAVSGVIAATGSVVLGSEQLIPVCQGDVRQLG